MKRGRKGQPHGFREKYEELVNSIDGIVWEAVMGRPGYTFISTQAERILGYPIQRWLSEPGFWKTIVFPEDLRELEEKHPVREHGNRVDGHREYRVVASDGRRLWIRDYVRVIRDGEGMPLLRGVMVDISDRRRAEAELSLSRLEALRSVKAKSDLLANISHEIRTPLNTIIGMSVLAQELALDPTLLEYLTMIKTSADTLLALIHQVLDFSKFEAGQGRAASTDFSVTEICERAINFVSYVAEKKRLPIRVDLSDEVKGFWRGDPNCILQTLVNLLGNSVKYTSEGWIRLSAGPAGNSSQAEHPVIRFEVVDTGSGIDEKSRAKLFEPFSRVDSTLTPGSYTGTGLGLSICKRLVELMGGTIGVHSAGVPGRGSTFWFDIPLERRVYEKKTDSIPIIEQTRAIKQDSMSIAKPPILVADDNAANRKVLLRFLERLGYPASATATAEDTIRLYRSGVYALILMDCQMPEIDGFEATRRIRAIERLENRRPIPIVAVTAHAMPEDRERCLASGMDDYLAKPLILDELSRVLRRSLDPELAETDRFIAERAPPEPTVRKEPDHFEPEIFHAEPRVSLAYFAELDKVSEGGSPDLVADLIEIFTSEGIKTIGQLRALAANHDWNRYRDIAHQFKTTCRHAGASRLGAMIAHLEKLGERFGPDEVLRALSLFIFPEYAQSSNELKRYVVERRARPAA